MSLFPGAEGLWPRTEAARVAHTRIDALCPGQLGGCQDRLLGGVSEQLEAL